MLQFSLQHRVTYRLRTCTPEETQQIPDHVVCYVMEAVQADTGEDFDGEEAVRERLRILARMKGGGIKRATETRYPAFLGALVDGGQRGMYPGILHAAAERGDWGRSIRQRGPQERAIPGSDRRGTVP